VPDCTAASNSRREFLVMMRLRSFYESVANF
jgi:hypothetical protein